MEEKTPSARELTFRRQKALRKMRQKSLAGELSEKEVSSLMEFDKTVEKAIKEQAAKEANAAIRIKGVTEKIDTMTPQKVISGSEFKSKIAKKLGKKLPGLAGMALSLGSFIANPSNASAAEAIGVESMGSNPAIEDPTSPQYKARMRMLKKRKKR